MVSNSSTVTDVLSDDIGSTGGGLLTMDPFPDRSPLRRTSILRPPRIKEFPVPEDFIITTSCLFRNTL